METKGINTGGVLAESGNKFTCKIGDSIEAIKKQNTHLTDDELQIVFGLTREQIEQEYEQELTE